MNIYIVNEYFLLNELYYILTIIEDRVLTRETNFCYDSLKKMFVSFSPACSVIFAKPNKRRKTEEERKKESKKKDRKKTERMEDINE